MTAREMLPEQLAEMRAFYDGDDGEIGDLLAHVDALAAKLATVERERDDARRMLERATPWDVRRPSEPSTEEMYAIRSRWGTGPEKYQADADALICGIIHARERADAAEAKLRALVEALDADGVTRTASNDVRAAIAAARGGE